VKLDITTAAGATAGTVDVPEDLFGVEPNIAVMHQVVTAQLAHRRAGTHSTKTRAEVAGGGAKPWRQKGTGRARQGSIRAPQWRGGGIAHGPKPRDYTQRTPKKMVRLALRSALSDRAAESRIKVVDDWGIDEPRTKRGIEVLESLGLRPAGERTPRLLVVLDRNEHTVWKSLRNLGARIQITLPEELNAHDVLLSDWLVFTSATLQATVAHFSSGTTETAADGDTTSSAATKTSATKTAATKTDATETAADEPAADEPAAASDEAVEPDEADEPDEAGDTPTDESEAT
jgi:large subunit ribosomal protein L4